MIIFCHLYYAAYLITAFLALIASVAVSAVIVVLDIATLFMAEVSAFAWDVLVWGWQFFMHAINAQLCS